VAFLFDLQITQEDSSKGIWNEAEADLFDSRHLSANVNWGELPLSIGGGKTAKQCLKRHKRLIALNEQDGADAAQKQQQQQQQQQQSTTVFSLLQPIDPEAWQSSLR
jgi:hypothetical protein